MEGRAREFLFGETAPVIVWRRADAEPRLFSAGYDETDSGAGMQG